MAKNKARQKRTDDELRYASLAIQYELNQLYCSYDLIDKANVGWASTDYDKAVSNAFLNAMLMSARSLIAFLYSYNPRDSDIVAEDFFDDPSAWHAKRVVPSPEMADGTLMGSISKHLAHLTWDRTDEEKPLWGGFRIVWNVVLAVESFVALVDKCRIHGALSTDVALMKNLLQQVLDQHPEWIEFMAPSMDTMQFDIQAYFDGNDEGESEVMGSC